MAIEPYENELIDLWALGFMFAVENIDPRIGRLMIQQVHYINSGEEVEKKIKPLVLVQCEDLWKENGFNN